MSERVLLHAEGLKKVYRSGSVSHTAVDCTDLRIEKGDFITIVGASGSGKSSLMYLLAGMTKPDSGKLFLGNKSVWDMTKKQRAWYRGHEVGFVYQDSNLIDDMNILCNVSLPGYLYERRRAVDKRSGQWLQYLGLFEMKNKFPKELSGGQRQKAALARALINKPKLLLLDEPTGSLDFASGNRILDLLLLININGQTIVMVTHDISAAARGNRVLFIRDGKICQTLYLGKYEIESKAERESAIYQMMRGEVKET